MPGPRSRKRSRKNRGRRLFGGNAVCGGYFRRPDVASRVSTAQLLPGSAGVHHPQIGVRRSDYLKRHPEITPLSPTVAPTVLDKSELLRLVVTQTEYFVLPCSCSPGRGIGMTPVSATCCD